LDDLVEGGWVCGSGRGILGSALGVVTVGRLKLAIENFELLLCSKCSEGRVGRGRLQSLQPEPELSLLNQKLSKLQVTFQQLAISFLVK
jgi:hypothetical protein